MATFESKNFKLEIEQCEGYNPREDDNITKMVCFNRRYNLGDKHDYRHENYNNFSELKDDIIKNENVAIIEPLYLYDHSGITISTTPFNCRWDSGQVGFVFITKESIRQNYGIKNVTKKYIEKSKEILKGEVKTYDDYITGNVYCYHLEADGTDDSCSGFLGDVKDNGIFEYIPNECLIELYPQIKSEYGKIEYIESLL